MHRMSRQARISVVCALAFVLAGCEESGDYLEVSGGGFLFNYRLAEATYGIVLRPLRTMPEGSVIEATLENPDGGEPIVIRSEYPFDPGRIAIDTPPVEGIVKDHPYTASIVLRDAAGATLQTIETTFESDLDQSVLPERPLAIGPGYQENIDESTTAYPPSLGTGGAPPPPQ
jgi:hypothetical protein